MVNEQTHSNEYIAQTVAKAGRAAIQTMSIAGAARTEILVPRMSGPIMNLPMFKWSSKDKNAE